MNDVDRLLEDLKGLLPTGVENAAPAPLVAQALGVSTRTLRELVGELIDREVLVGSSCTGNQAGYFLIATWADLEMGTSHLVSRARALFRRVHQLERAAQAKFGQGVLPLFELADETQNTGFSPTDGGAS